MIRPYEQVKLFKKIFSKQGDPVETSLLVHPHVPPDIFA